MPRQIEAAAQRLRAWLVDAALPLWAGAGFDSEHGRFEEQLAMDGRRLAVPHRLIVQARQIHAYTLAARRGWHPEGDRLARAAYRAMVRDYRSADGQPGWVYTVARDGTPVDARRDLYSHAFVLLALGSYVGRTGDPEARGMIDETLGFLDERMRSPRGGYIEVLPAAGGPRRQNPHMHLFEAMLNLWEHTRERQYLDRAGKMFRLFTERFYQPVNGVLLEYFGDDWTPAPGEIGHVVEPGHHCEWIWLLRWYEREAGADVQPFVDGLYRHLVRYGRDAAGLLPDELLDDGRCRTASRRLWPMTEAIKAHLLEARRHREGALETAGALADTMYERFLADAPAGGWIDRLDAAGEPVGDYMPASSLYHVIGAIDELDRFVASP